MNIGQESSSDISLCISKLKTFDNQNDTEYNKNDKGNKEDDYLKTNTVTDIINNNINKMESYLNGKVINIYKRPWKKLETKLKLKKIEEYYNFMSKAENIENKSVVGKGVHAFGNFTFLQIKSILNGNMEKKKLKVDYDVESCKIISLVVS